MNEAREEERRTQRREGVPTVATTRHGASGGSCGTPPCILAGEAATTTWLPMRGLLAKAWVCASTGIAEPLCQCRLRPAGGGYTEEWRHTCNAIVCWLCVRLALQGCTRHGVRRPTATARCVTGMRRRSKA
jgi:hypothetical protein